MPGGYYKRGWKTGLELLDKWWCCSCTYHYQNIGTVDMPKDYRKWTYELVEFTRDVAKQDPTPFWTVGRLIDDHAGITPSIGELSTTMRDIEHALHNAVLLKDYLFKVGTTDRRAGRKKSPKTEEVEGLIDKKLNVNTIQSEARISAAAIRQIKHRQKRRRET